MAQTITTEANEPAPPVGAISREQLEQHWATAIRLWDEAKAAHEDYRSAHSEYREALKHMKARGVAIDALKFFVRMRDKDPDERAAFFEAIQLYAPVCGSGQLELPFGASVANGGDDGRAESEAGESDPERAESAKRAGASARAAGRGYDSNDFDREDAMFPFWQAGWREKDKDIARTKRREAKAAKDELAAAPAEGSA